MSIYTEDQLFSIDNKIKEMDVMVSLFESKLNSLPSDVVSRFPQLKQVDLGDFNSEIFKFENIIPSSTGNNLNNPILIEVNKEKEPETNNLNNDENTVKEAIEEVKEEVIEEETPYQKLERLKREYPQLETIGKSLKLGIPSAAVYQKAKMQDIDPELTDDFIKTYKIVNPSTI